MRRRSTNTLAWMLCGSALLAGCNQILGNDPDAFVEIDDDTPTGGTTPDGTGGVVPPGSGGTPSTGGTPSSGGAPPGSGGAPGTGGGGTPPDPPGPGTYAITHESSGNLSAATWNVLGMDGVYFPVEDSAGSTILADFDSGSICVEGTGIQVPLPCPDAPDPNDCFGYAWGAQVSLDPLAAGPYNAEHYGIVGLSFDITGPSIPPNLRFRAVEWDEADLYNNGDIYCTPITPGSQTIRFEDLELECWNNAGNEDLITSSNLHTIEWQVHTEPSANIPFDFCIENLRAIVE